MTGSPSVESRPAGVTVTLPSSGTLVIQDGTRSMSYAVSSGQHTVYNITPGSAGVYYLKDSSDKIAAAGLLKPTGALRMIRCSSTNNVRDLGGWACDGGAVKYGKLFRGGRLFAGGNPDSYDIAVLHDLLGIRHELDLRGDSEIPYQYSGIGNDVAWTHIEGSYYSISDSVSYKAMLDCVIDCALQNIPLYFHCTAGADRTGTLALLIEAILGVSQSDMDKDYELTSFATGIETDAVARRRDESDWTGLIGEINAYIGSTFRDKVVNWALTIGIPIERINAFRVAMIDGTPSTLVGGVGTATVTRTLSGASVDNTENTVTKYQPYQASVTPDAGKIISSVQVTMGGTDITESVFSGDDTVFRHSVSYSLTYCSLSTSPIRRAVIAGECFCCALQADTGYSLNDEDDPTVSITMGGVNVSSYYKNGVINIPRVTGNLVINVTAAASAPAYTNQITGSKDAIGGSTIYNGTGYKQGYRYNSAYTETEAADRFTTGYIHLTQGDVVRFYGNVISGSNSAATTVFYKQNGTYDFDFKPSSFANGEHTSNTDFTSRLSSVSYDSTNQVLHSFVWNASYDVWVKFTCIGTFTDGTTVITINEEM